MEPWLITLQKKDICTSKQTYNVIQSVWNPHSGCFSHMILYILYISTAHGPAETGYSFLIEKKNSCFHHERHRRGLARSCPVVLFCDAHSVLYYIEDHG